MAAPWAKVNPATILPAEAGRIDVRRHLAALLRPTLPATDAAELAADDRAARSSHRADRPVGITDGHGARLLETPLPVGRPGRHERPMFRRREDGGQLDTLTGARVAVAYRTATAATGGQQPWTADPSVVRGAPEPWDAATVRTLGGRPPGDLTDARAAAIGR